MAKVLCFPLFCFFVLYTHIEAKINDGGFSVELIRIGSPNSPLVHSFYQVPTYGPFTKVTSNNGDYLMKLTLGSPPVDLYGLADTGSDLIWAQCTPCYNCYEQKAPMFDPTKSKTYSAIPCGSEQCGLLPYGASCSPENTCEYTYGYADSSVTRGVLAKETFTVGTSGGEVDIVFGCGYNNSGSFNENDMGIVGLGGGPLSLVSQIGAIYGGRRFSQCLVPFHTDPNIAGIYIWMSI